jgi:transposase
MTNMNYIGLDVHKKTINYCVKDATGQVLQDGKVGSTRRELDCWIQTLPQPRTIAMEATIFTGWIYDYLLPHAEKVKVAHPLMLRAIAAAKKKNDTIDAGKIADACAAISCRSVTWSLRRFEIDVAPCATGICSYGRWCR